MTGAAAAPVGASELQSGGSPAAPAPSPPHSNVPLEPEAARARIEVLKGDKDFFGRLSSSDQAVKQAALQEWTALHQAGFPAPAPVDAAAYGVQVAARSAQQWNEYMGWLKQRIALTPEMEAEVRNGVVREETWRWAREEKDRLVKDRAFYRRLMDGDRKATEDWERIKLLVGLRPVKVP
jgi:hypothetical protein